VGQAYCFGGKSLYWGGWCPRLLASDLTAWPPTVAQYLNQNYPALEQQTGVDVKTDFIQGPLFDLLKSKINTVISTSGVANLDSVEDPPLAVQGQAPASGRYSALTNIVARRFWQMQRASRAAGQITNAGSSSFPMPMSPVLSPRAEPSQASKCRSTAHPSFFRSIRIAR
jgi:hypothetical protein